MKQYSFSAFAPMLTDRGKGDEIYKAIKALHPEQERIEIDLSDMESMATFCARQIFGRLYVELGADCFGKNIILKNMTEDVEYIIKWGIQCELDAQ